MPAKKHAAQKAVPRKTAAKKTPAKKVAAKKSAVTKVPSRKATTKKATAKKATAKRQAGPTSARPHVRAKRTPPKASSPVPERPADTQIEAGDEAVREAGPPGAPPPSGAALAGPRTAVDRPVAGVAPSTVVVSFEGPARQRRLTIAVRVILAIPHLAYLAVLNVVAFFAAVAAWFAALVLGRLPEGLATFLGRVVQYNARVGAYAQFLLTDRYPPFSLSDPDYAVAVELAPGRLSRAAVFFRIILLVPAYIVTYFVGIGFSLAAAFIWLIALIAGRLPTPVFEANAAVLRYITRFWAYAAMLTSVYPGGLLGDRP